MILFLGVSVEKHMLPTPLDNKLWYPKPSLEDDDLCKSEVSAATQQYSENQTKELVGTFSAQLPAQLPTRYGCL